MGFGLRVYARFWFRLADLRTFSCSTIQVLDSQGFCAPRPLGFKQAFEGNSTINVYGLYWDTASSYSYSDIPRMSVGSP